METDNQHADENVKALKKTFRFIENYYFSLPNQGNVYTLAPLKSSTGSCKILIASLQKKIFCIEYNDGKYAVHENPLACIPNGADIVSLNAYNKNDKFDIGLTAIQKDGSTEQSLLNLYSDWELGKTLFFNQEMTSFTSIKLNFIPYVLYYTLLPTSSGNEIVWLLSGSDWCIHVFRFLKETNKYQETSSIDEFPEFEHVHGITLNLDILYSDDRRSRITTTSGESGNVHLFKVDLSNKDKPIIKASREINFDFPSSATKIFNIRNKVCDLKNLKIDTIGHINKTKTGLQSGFGAKNSPCILVATTLESCSVYSDFASNEPGFQLPESNNYDVVTCCMVADVNFDGVNEIVLGTYGQTILIYKQSLTNPPRWDLMQSIATPSPVLSLAYEDVLGDGVRELVVATMAGIHVFQCDPVQVSDLIISRLRKLKNGK